MTDQRNTPDTRTPSAEGCGHQYHSAGYPDSLRRGWNDDSPAPDLCPLPGQGSWTPDQSASYRASDQPTLSDAPNAPNRAPASVRYDTKGCTDDCMWRFEGYHTALCGAPNRAPTDALTHPREFSAGTAALEWDAGHAPDRAPTDEARCTDERHRSHFPAEGSMWGVTATRTDLGSSPGLLWAERCVVAAPTEGTADRDALALAADLRMLDFRLHGDFGAPTTLLRSAAALEDLTRENERLRAAWDNADAIAHKALDERDDLRRQVAAVRALADEDDPDGTGWPCMTQNYILTALDTASEDRGDGQGQEKRDG